MTPHAPLPNIPCFQALYQFPTSKGKPQLSCDALFDHDTLNRLKDSATTLKENNLVLRNNTYKKLLVGNATYLAHGLIPAAAFKYGAINTEQCAQYADFIKAHLPSFLQTLLPPQTATDQPCLIPTWMNVAAVMTGCCALLSVANFNRKMTIHSYEKEDSRIEQEIADTRSGNCHRLQNMYNSAARKLDHYFANDAVCSPKAHQALRDQAMSALNSLPHLYTALITKGLSPQEASQVLRPLTKVLRLIERTEVGLRNSDQHTLYNTKFLAQSNITAQNCIPHRAQYYLSLANQKTQTASLFRRSLSALVCTTVLAAPITFAATYVDDSAKIAVEAAKKAFECTHHATSWDAAYIKSNCLQDLPIQDITWTASAVFSTAFVVYATLKMSQWAVGKIFRRNAVPAQDMQKAIERTQQVYDAVAVYLEKTDDEADPVRRSSRKPARKEVEEKSGDSRSSATSSGRSEKIALAQAIQLQLTPIEAALAKSGLTGCKPAQITQNLRNAISKLLSE